MRTKDHTNTLKHFGASILTLDMAFVIVLVLPWGSLMSLMISLARLLRHECEKPSWKPDSSPLWSWRIFLVKNICCESRTEQSTSEIRGPGKWWYRNASYSKPITEMFCFTRMLRKLIYLHCKNTWEKKKKKNDYNEPMRQANLYISHRSWDIFKSLDVTFLPEMVPLPPLFFCV